MPTATLTPRLIYKEDLAATTTRGETASATVLGAGSTTLNKVDAIFLSDLVSAANDAAAAALGVGVGALYYCSADGKPHARLS
jgi:hypothetical protein